MQKNDVESEIVCDVCMSDFVDETTNDELVICEKCNVATHLSCYGHDLIHGIPEGDWICQRCLELDKIALK